MARRVVALTLVCSLAALLPARAGDPVEPLRLERLLGPDVIACVRIDTRLATWEGPVRGTAMGRLAADPEVAGALAPLWQALADLFGPPGEFKDEVPTPVPRALRWVLEGLRGVSGDLSVAWRDGPVDGVPPLAALLDFGPRLSEAVAFFERWRARFAVDGVPSVEPAPAGGPPEHGSWRVWVASPVDGALVPVHLQILGTALLASTDEPWLHGVLARGIPTGPGPESLASSAAFLGLHERTGGAAAAAWAYVNLALLRERLAGEEGWLPGPFDEVLGLRAWRAAAYGLSFDRDRVVERVALDAPRAGGLLGLLAQGPGPPVGLDLAPRSTLFHAELGFEVAPALERALAMVDALDADEGADLRRFLAGLRGASGADLETEVLARFTGREALWLTPPPTGGLVPEVAFVARVREPAAFEAALERVLTELLERWSASGELLATARVLPASGARLHVIDLDRPAGDGLAPFTPTWAVVGDRLLVTLVPHAMREVLARARAGEPALRDAPEASGLLGGVRDEEARARVHVDTAAAFRCLYDTGAPLLQTARGSFGPALPAGFDPATLPATRTVAPHLRATQLALRLDPGGAELTVTAPLPPIALSIAAALLLRWTRPEAPPPPEPVEAAAAFVRDDPEARTIEVLSGVLSALREHRARVGAWPDRLEDLVERSRLLASIPVDGWGHPLRYGPGSRPGSVLLRSPGQDGIPDTDDDRTDEADAGDR